VSRYDVSGETFVDPKVSSSYSLGPARFRAGFAFDHQVANRITREDLEHGDRTFWALSDGSTIPVARARQVVAGATVEGNGVLFDVQAYYKSLDGLSLFAPRLYPGIAPGDETPLMFEGSGTVRGVGFFLRQHSGANTLWISTTLSRAEYSYPSLEPGAFPASQDQAAELKVVDAFRFARIWSVSGAWIAATPRPETPATGVGAVWFPSGASLTRVVFGSKNSERLPAYHRLDVSTQVDLRARSIPIVLGLTLVNVYDRKNIAYREYEVVGDALGTNDVTLMGRAVNASVRFVF
jgi:hypothetical protein